MQLAPLPLAHLALTLRPPPLLRRSSRTRAHPRTLRRVQIRVAHPLPIPLNRAP